MDVARSLDRVVDTRSVAENMKGIQHRFWLLMREAPRNVSPEGRLAMLQQAILAKEAPTK